MNIFHWHCFVHVRLRAQPCCIVSHIFCISTSRREKKLWTRLSERSTIRLWLTCAAIMCKSRLEHYIISQSLLATWLLLKKFRVTRTACRVGVWCRVGVRCEITSLAQCQSAIYADASGAKLHKILRKWLQEWSPKNKAFTFCHLASNVQVMFIFCYCYNYQHIVLRETFAMFAVTFHTDFISLSFTPEWGAVPARSLLTCIQLVLRLRCRIEHVLRLLSN